jgi:branched-chain amino acid aminotransferase
MIEEKQLGRDQLSIADEVFMCGTAAEVAPVTEVDFRKIGSGSIGPVTRQLSQAFRSVVSGKHPRSSQWLDQVDDPAAILSPASMGQSAVLEL